MKSTAKVKNVGRGEGSFSVDPRINRGGSNSYSHIWILTLKRIYAEGLQQRAWKEIDIASIEGDRREQTGYNSPKLQDEGI